MTQLAGYVPVSWEWIKSAQNGRLKVCNTTRTEFLKLGHAIQQHAKMTNLKFRTQNRRFAQIPHQSRAEIGLSNCHLFIRSSAASRGKSSEVLDWLTTAQPTQWSHTHVNTSLLRLAPEIPLNRPALKLSLFFSVFACIRFWAREMVLGRISGVLSGLLSELLPLFPMLGGTWLGVTRGEAAHWVVRYKDRAVPCLSLTFGIPLCPWILSHHP